MHQYVNVNGQLSPIDQPMLKVDNRAFRYGFGLFETMRIVDGEIRLWLLHEERLVAGLSTLGMTLGKLQSTDKIKKEIQELALKNGHKKSCRVRLQLFMGHGGLYDAPGKLGYVIEAMKMPSEVAEWNENGLAVGIANGLFKTRDKTANLKTSNALIYALSAQQAKAEKWNDALILNTNHEVVESTIANIFWVKDGQVYTPPLLSGCVAGVMRRWIIELLAKGSQQVMEEVCSQETLSNADEVFLTNAIRQVKWVKEFGRNRYGNRTAKAIASLVNKEIGNA